MKKITIITILFIFYLLPSDYTIIQGKTPLCNIDTKTMSVFSAHNIAVHKKFKFSGESSNSTLLLTYKDFAKKRIYYLTSKNTTALGLITKEYMASYKSEMIKSGMPVKNFDYQGLNALYGVSFTQGVYLYQLHFINKDKAQTIQMINQTKSDLLFQQYMNEIKIIK